MIRQWLVVVQARDFKGAAGLLVRVLEMMHVLHHGMVHEAGIRKVQRNVHALRDGLQLGFQTQIVGKHRRPAYLYQIPPVVEGYRHRSLEQIGPGCTVDDVDDHLEYDTGRNTYQQILVQGEENRH